MCASSGSAATRIPKSLRSWGARHPRVNNVTTLLQKGEKRLLAAAEAGHIPLHLAVGIARATDVETQQLLQDAYEKGDLRGKQIFRIRQILEHRNRSGKQAKMTL